MICILQVIRTLDRKNNNPVTTSSIDVQTLRSDLQEKDRLIEKLEVRVLHMHTHTCSVNLYYSCRGLFTSIILYFHTLKCESTSAIIMEFNHT